MTVKFLESNKIKPLIWISLHTPNAPDIKLFNNLSKNKILSRHLRENPKIFEFIKLKFFSEFIKTLSMKKTFCNNKNRFSVDLLMFTRETEGEREKERIRARGCLSSFSLCLQIFTSLSLFLSHVQCFRSKKSFVKFSFESSSSSQNNTRLQSSFWFSRY